ncbi:MAG: hypothetical protein A4E28_00058 [Methanocella sp. PtaU1.Bin125]|nr:MAG: hypothetical protein A4E28_00058 [Methanocella sp. PtaU1.Bin125]
MAFEVRFGDVVLRDRYNALPDSHLSEDRELYNIIRRTIKEKLIINPARGRVIKRELIPATYLNKYGNKTFFIWNLTASWRLIYFLAREEDRRLIIIVDWLSHSDYEKLFKF